MTGSLVPKTALQSEPARVAEFAAWRAKGALRTCWRGRIGEWLLMVISTKRLVAPKAPAREAPLVSAGPSMTLK